MNTQSLPRRVQTAVAAAALLGAAGLGTALSVAPADAVPSVGPNVSPTMFTGKLGVGCTYIVSVVVTDHQAPVQLQIVDQSGHVVSRLATRNEVRTDAKRVVEGNWIANRAGTMRAVAIQNGVRKSTKPFPVSPALNTGSMCFGV